MPMTLAPAIRWVAGVDGCRAGWVVVLRDRLAGIHCARVVPDFLAVLALPEAPTVLTPRRRPPVGSAIVMPTTPPIDSRGLRMELWR